MPLCFTCSPGTNLPIAPPPSTGEHHVLSDRCRNSHGELLDAARIFLPVTMPANHPHLSAIDPDVFKFILWLCRKNRPVSKPLSKILAVLWSPTPAAWIRLILPGRHARRW